MKILFMGTPDFAVPCLERLVKDGYDADLLIVAGTSLTVYPAASLVRYYRGRRLVLINRDETPYDREANLIFRESIGQVLELTARTGKINGTVPAGRMLVDGAGVGVKTPVSRPKTIREAGMLAKDIFNK